MTMVDDGVKIHGFHVDGVAVVVVRGELDSDAAHLLRAEFNRLGPDEHVYVDCGRVDFVDSEGLAALCEAGHRNVMSGGPLHVLASSALRHSVESNGVGHLFDLD